MLSVPILCSCIFLIACLCNHSSQVTTLFSFGHNLALFIVIVVNTIHKINYQGKLADGLSSIWQRLLQITKKNVPSKLRHKQKQGKLRMSFKEEVAFQVKDSLQIEIIIQ